MSMSNEIDLALREFPSTEGTVAQHRFPLLCTALFCSAFLCTALHCTALLCSPFFFFDFSDLAGEVFIPKSISHLLTSLRCISFSIYLSIKSSCDVDADPSPCYNITPCMGRPVCGGWGPCRRPVIRYWRSLRAISEPLHLQCDDALCPCMEGKNRCSACHIYVLYCTVLCSVLCSVLCCVVWYFI